MASCRLRFSQHSVMPHRVHAPLVSLRPLGSQCGHAVCKKWLEDPSKARSRPRAMQVLHSFIMPGEDNTTRGAVLFERVVGTVPSHSWLEVMRMRTPQLRQDHGEGVDGYGCWLFPARGSGIWINTGESFRAPTEWALYHNNSASLKTMWGRWSQDHPLDAARSVQRAHKERYPAWAHSLGLTTVQLGARHLTGPWKTGTSHAQLVITTDVCTEGRKPLRTCMPSTDLRSGSAANRPCLCNEASMALNCDHADLI